MSSTSIGQALSAGDVSKALALLSRKGAAPLSGAALLLTGEPLQVVWANRAATVLFEASEAAGLHEAIFAGGDGITLRDRLMRLPVEAASRLERLHLKKGERTQAITVSLLRSTLASGEPLYSVAVPGSRDLPDATANVLVSAPVELPASKDEPPMPADEPQVERPAPPPVGSEAMRLAEEVSARLATIRSNRFVWQTDAQHRVTKLANGLPELLGMTDDALLGRVFPEVMQALGCDPEGHLARAFESRATWSGVALLWPVKAMEVAVQAHLGALPLFNPAKTFDGFRGFGIVDFTHIEAAPIRLDALAKPIEEVEPQNIDVSGTADLPLAEATLEVDDGAAAVIEPETPPVGSFSSKVIALRPHQWPAPFSGAVASLPREASISEVERIDEAAPGHLSSVERSALLEIARVLGVKPERESDGAGVPANDDPLPPPPLEGKDGKAVVTVASLSPETVALLDQLSAAVLMVGGDRPLYVNPAFRKLTGYASAEALTEAGGLPHLLGSAESQQGATAPEDRNFSLLDAMGQNVPVEGRLQTIVLNGRQVLMGSFRPTADRAFKLQNLEFELRRREAEAAEVRHMLDIVSDALLVLDRDGRLLSLNQPAELLFDCIQNEVVGQSVTHLLEPEGHARVLAALSVLPLAEAGLPSAVDVTGRGSRGRGPTLQMTARPIGADRIVAIFRDQSADLAMARHLAEARAALEAERAGKSDFLAKVSHEVRTPLNAILGFAEVILDERFGPIGNPRYSDYLRDIHEAGAHVMNLVSDLLDLSKVEAGRLDMSLSAVDANRIVGECVGQMQAHAHRERVIMRLSLSPRLPSALVDERAFRQVVTNILSNAVKFNEPGGQVIVSTAINDAGAIAVRIRDTGIGMSDEEIGMAMEPFRQIATSNGRGGSGLGLPLTKALVEANEASLTIKSRKNEGTLVEIVLKACPAEPMRVPAE